MDRNTIELNKEAIDLTIKLLTEAKENGCDKVVLFEYITGHSDEVKASILKGNEFTYKDIISYKKEKEEDDILPADSVIEVDE